MTSACGESPRRRPPREAADSGDMNSNSQTAAGSSSVSTARSTTSITTAPRRTPGRLGEAPSRQLELPGSGRVACALPRFAGGRRSRLAPYGPLTRWRSRDYAQRWNDRAVPRRGTKTSVQSTDCRLQRVAGVL